MSGFIPTRPWGGDERSDRPEPRLQGVRTEAEVLGRWEVRAAQYRALSLAQETFGDPARGSLLALRHEGSIRGLLHLEVPFLDLDTHREREQVFMSRAAEDPVLSRVSLVYVLAAANG